jgi:hypothetical protein
MKLDLTDLDRTADAGLRNDAPCQVSGRELKALVAAARALKPFADWDEQDESTHNILQDPAIWTAAKTALKN